MKFLIAGLGSIGRRHLNNLLALGERDILLYRTHKGALPDDELAGFHTELDLTTALEHKPDAVIVSNPTAHHLDVAIPAAQAGCHLLIEKPISHNWERVDELRAAVAKGGGRVLVGFQFRFHPGLKKVAELLMDNAIGRPVSVRAHWGEYLPDWHPWEDYRQSYSARADMGGGVILTLCHPLDYLRWLLGDVASLWASTAKSGELELDVEDVAEIGLQFTNGVIGSLHLDYLQRPPAHNLEIIGSRGTLRWDNADGVTNLYRVSAGDWESFSPPKDFDRNHLFLSEMRHFLEIVRGEDNLACTLDDGIKALRLALAALQSSKESKSFLFE
ncbi:MAG: Gfo/Idh/MocA family oxidoreductase [Chloroflexi bacterium]|nr:Gfo/Idh/MocA family oxidoreductase [Chloroflexota bacterium]